MPETKSPGRDYKVVKGQVGPWPLNHVFAESEFRRLNPAPKDGPSGKPATEVDDDAYYDTALSRLTGLGVVEQVNTNREPAYEPPKPAPVGPESTPPKPAPPAPGAVVHTPGPVAVVQSPKK